MLGTRHPVAVTLAVLAIIAGAYVAIRTWDPSLVGVVLGDDPAPPFTLQAESRGAVSVTEFEGEVLLLTFGRICPEDDCRTDLRTIDRALDRLGDRRRDVRVLFVTTNPADRTEQLRAFVQDVDLGMTGVGGDSTVLARVAAAYRAQVPDSVRATAEGASPAAPATAIVPAPGIFGIDRRGRLRVYWGPEVDARDIARDVRRLLRSRG